MITVELRFRAGRYHATPWGRHVNEAAVEWPPSPYRLLRALYDVWKRRAPELRGELVEQVFRKLAAVRPAFYLPQAVSAHTRSYLNSNTKHASDKSLIFDGFLSLDPDAPCSVQWRTEFDQQELDAFRTLLDRLNYLGRSESWIEARLAENSSFPINCMPVNGDMQPEEEIVDVASPISPSEYSGKRSWFDALTYSTTEMVKDKRSGPLAMEVVPYQRGKGAIATWLSPSATAHKTAISLLELSFHSKVLPLATDTVRIAELVRCALMKRAEQKSRLFSGKDEHGNRLTGKHQHSFFLPQFDALSRINRVLVVLNGLEFGSRELEAARSLRRIWQFGEESMRVVLTRAESADVLARSRSVTSLTPFVPALHWRPGRGNWDSFIEEQVGMECRNHGLPPPIRIVPAEGNRRFEAVHFRRSRKGEAPRKGEFLSLEFGEPVRVPFTLGYCCHFGLGQFGPLRS